MEINQYPLESLTFQDNDFYDIDFWTGSGYQTKKILGSTIKAGILAAVENIYNADGSLNGNRSVDLDGNIISFNSANAGEFNVLVSDSSTSTSTFNQSIAQIYLAIVDILTAGKNVAFDINTTNTQLVLNDGAGNSSSLQISGVGSALNFSDGISNYRVEANENGVVINTSYTLPNTDGTNGQVMTTNGAGVVSWQDGTTTIVSWGDIVGTLSDQTDLQDALDAKLNDPEGIASQYIRGDGTLGIFPSVGGGGGGSVYYFNGNTSQGSIGGTTMYQLSKVAQTGAPANFNRSTTGTIASFITDVNDPNQLSVPSGIWLFECYLSETGGGANHATIQCIVEKWDGTTISVIGTGVVEEITNGNVKDLYTLGVTIPSGITLSATDRIVVQVQIANPNGKTVTLYTENTSVSSVTTTFANGISSLNGLSPATQLLTTGTSGTDFTINSSGNTHTFNIPTASATKTGKLSSTDWSTFNNKVDDNVYTADGTLTGTRIVDLNGEAIAFQDPNASGGSFIVNIDNGTILSAFTLQPNIFDLESLNLALGSVITGTPTSLLLKYIGSSGIKQMQINNGGLRINGQYYLPNTDGTSGQVVTTDGAGNLSFTTIGSSTAFIPSVESTEIRRGVIALSGSTTLGTYGALTPVQNGSAVAVNFGGTTKLPKLRLLTSTGSTNSVVGIHFGTQGLVNTITFGFRFIGSYIFTDQSSGGTEWFVPNARQFCGLAAQSTILAINSGTTLESQLNIIGIGSDATDTNLQIFHNDNTGTATKIDLGVNFPANKTGAVANGIGYQLELYAPYGATSVKYRVTKLSDNTFVTGTISTNLPASTTALGPQVVRTSGATSQNVSIDVIQLTASTLY